MDRKANNLRRKIRGSEEIWRKKEAAEMKNDGAKTWKNVKSWIGWKVTNQPEQLKDAKNGGKMSCSPKRNCTIMNDFYTEKVKTIKDKMPQVEEDPCDELRKMLSGRRSVFKLRAMTPDEVSKTAKRMRKST